MGFTSSLMTLHVRGAVSQDLGSRRRAVIAHSSPFEDIQRISDVIQGQFKASEGVGVSTIVELVADNTKRVARGFEPLPRDFPAGPSGEQGLKLALDPLDFLRSTRNTYGGVATVIIGGERVVLVGDQDVAKAIVQDEPHVWVKEGTAFFPGSALAGNGLLVSDGKIWKRQRKLSNPAFRKSQVALYSMAMTHCTTDMLDTVWSPEMGRTRDIYADFNQLTLDITLAALFGTKLASSNLGQQVSGSIREAFEHFSQRAASGFIIPEWLPTPDNMQYNGAVHRLDTFIYTLINRRKVELRDRGDIAKVEAGEEPSPDCLLDALLLSRDDDGRGMEDKPLRDELMTLLVAGQETSAILLGWICACLAWYPSAQAAAAAEVQEVLQGRTPTMDDIDKLPYCTAVVLETLRRHPPAYMIGRCANTDTRLGDSGYTVTKGTTALIAPYLLHHDSGRWENPATFNPDRWLVSVCDGEKLNWRAELKGFGHTGSFLPFGGGPRSCIGTAFAFVESILVVAMAIQRFSLVPYEQGQRFPQPQPLITLRPESVPVRLLPREPKHTPTVASDASGRAMAV